MNGTLSVEQRRLGDLVEAKYGKSLPQRSRKSGSVPVYGSNGVVGQHDTALTKGPAIVIGRKGSSGAINVSSGPCWPIDTTYYIDNPGPYSLEFLQRLLRSLRLDELDRSTAIPGLNRDQLYDIVVPVPSVEHQQVVVDRIRRIESTTSSAETRLSTAKAVLRRFRRSVIGAACVGELTSDWRLKNPDPRSPQPRAIERTEKKRTRSAHQPVELPIPELPEKYVMATLGAISEAIEYGTSRKCDASAGVPVLRMGNIQDGDIDFSDLKYCEPDAELERLRLVDGDLLFNRTNSPELVGKSAVFHGDGFFSFASYLIRVRVATELADPDYVCLWINSAWGREWARLAKTDGVSQSNINGTKLSLMPVPLPPLEEQREIVRRALRMLNVADQMTKRIDAAAAAVNRTRLAAMTKAFRGELSIDGKTNGSTGIR